jgi:hypothetical protein
MNGYGVGDINNKNNKNSMCKAYAGNYTKNLERKIPKKLQQTQRMSKSCHYFCNAPE